jgi:hypothetical protein
MNNLKTFGISDDALENGYLTLCNAYARKIHSQVMPMIINVLKSEKDTNAVEEDNDGYLFTNAPFNMLKIFSESFQIVTAKKIKELALRVLRVF